MALPTIHPAPFELEMRVKDPHQTMLELVNHILTLHPNLAPAVEELALMIQGKDEASMTRQRDAHQAREAQLFQGLNTSAISR